LPVRSSLKLGESLHLKISTSPRGEEIMMRKSEKWKTVEMMENNGSAWWLDGVTRDIARSDDVAALPTTRV
jgi:hypothetical protein